jgi:hypothetical protein
LNDKEGLRKQGLGRVLQLGALFRNDSTFNWADLQANAAVDAGAEIDPVPVSTLGVFARTLVNAGHWASVYAVGYALAGVGNNRMRHSVLSRIPNFSVAFRYARNKSQSGERRLEAEKSALWGGIAAHLWETTLYHEKSLRNVNKEL